MKRSAGLGSRRPTALKPVPGGYLQYRPRPRLRPLPPPLLWRILQVVVWQMEAGTYFSRWRYTYRALRPVA